MSNLTDALIAAKLVGGSGGSGGGSGIMHIHNVDTEYDETTGDVITPSHLSATYAEIASAIENDMLVYHDFFKGFVVNHYESGGTYNVIIQFPFAVSGASMVTSVVKHQSDSANGYLVAVSDDTAEYSFDVNSKIGLICVTAEATGPSSVECKLISLDGGVSCEVTVEGDDTERVSLDISYSIISPNTPVFYGEGTAADKDWIGGLLTQRLFGGWYDISGFSASGSTIVMPNCLFKSLVDNFTTAYFTL